MDSKTKSSTSGVKIVAAGVVGIILLMCIVKFTGVTISGTTTTTTTTTTIDEESIVLTMEIVVVALLAFLLILKVVSLAVLRGGVENNKKYPFLSSFVKSSDIIIIPLTFVLIIIFICETLAYL